MTLLSRIFLALGVFLIASGIAYGFHSGEYEGTALILTTAGGALLIGGFLAQGVRHAKAMVEQDRPAVVEGEPHVGPTIWPLVFALSMIGLVVGAVGSRWVLVIGFALCVVAGVGWILDVHRQWQHHYRATAGEGDGGAHHVGGG